MTGPERKVVRAAHETHSIVCALGPRVRYLRSRGAESEALVTAVFMLGVEEARRAGATDEEIVASLKHAIGLVDDIRSEGASV